MSKIEFKPTFIEIFAFEKKDVITTSGKESFDVFEEEEQE